jgi:hypothetical protein
MVKPRLSLVWYISLLGLGLFSCSPSAKFGMSDGHYSFKQGAGPAKRVDVYVDDNDRISVFEKSTPIALNRDQPQFFLLKTLDLDALAVPFKFRPGSSKLPRQLDTEFNGNIYLGYRLDRFRLTYRNKPGGLSQNLKQIGFSAGVFGGLGSTFISQWTTHGGTQDEYNGFILSRGLAFLVGFNNLTVGVGVGWDYLTDRDKDTWIYQNKPWYGLTVGLNVN